MKQFFILFSVVLFGTTAFAQVGIGTTTPEASAALDITSTSKGLLPPRMTTTEFELESDYAWVQLFGNGHQALGVKNNTYRVRAVRAF